MSPDGHKGSQSTTCTGPETESASNRLKVQVRKIWEVQMSAHVCIVINTSSHNVPSIPCLSSGMV